MAGTPRTPSAASVTPAQVHGRTGSGSVTGSRRVSAGSRRTSVGSRRTSAGSLSAKRASSSASLVKMNGGEMEMPLPPFVDNPEARRRADSGSHRTRPNTNTGRSDSMSAASPSAPPRGVPVANGDLDEDFAGQDLIRIKHGRDRMKTWSRHRKMESTTSEDDADDDASIYTQSSIGRGSVGSVSKRRHTNAPSISTAAPAPNADSPLTSAPSITTSPRPVPLSLGIPNGRITSGPSPLLHTTWGSPVSSNPGATPTTTFTNGRVGGRYTPLLGGGLDALSRDLAARTEAAAGKAVDLDEEDRGLASTLRQQTEVEKKPSPAPAVFNPDPNLNLHTELPSREGGLRNGKWLVVEDEDDEVVVSPSPASLQTDSEASGSIFNMPRHDSPEPEPEMAMNEGLVLPVVASRTPSPTSPKIGDGSTEDGEARERGRSEESLPSLVSSTHTGLPRASVVPSRNTTPNNTLQPPPSSSPSLPSPSASPTPSSPPSHLRPSLLDLRGGQPGPGQGQRRSLFLPHPNAPKAPSADSLGPMYIAQQHPPPQQLQARSGAVQSIRMALGGHGAPGRRPTIYGRTQVDLAASTGPVLMTFSVDPPPNPPVNAMPRTPLSPLSLPANSPGNRVASDVEKGGTPPASVERSAQADQAGSGVIPRANFFPKAGGARPRSRSFSGFNSQDTEVPLPIQRRLVFGIVWVSFECILMHTDHSYEEGSTILDVPSVVEVRRSLSPAGSLSPSLSPSPTKTSSLRVSSPLALSQNNSVGPGGSSFQKPPSGFPTHTANSPSSPPSSFNNRSVHQLKKTISKGDLNESSPSASSPRPHPAMRTTPSGSNTGSESIPTSPIVLPGQGRDSTSDSISARGHPSGDTDGASLHSTRSHVVSPPLDGRQPSLRNKFSLPNLRRNASRQDDTSSIGSTSQPLESDLVQVKDMDFELVRPNLSHLHPNQSSEDPSLLGRDGLGDFKYPNSLRTDSPAVSASAPRSPIVSDGSSPSSRLPLTLPNVQSKSSESESSMDAHRQRELKWMSVLSSVAPSQAKKSKKVRKLLLEGVPSSVRYLVWTHLTDGKARCVPGVYSQLGARGRVPAFIDIERDVQRCFNDHPHLQSMHGSIVSLLQAYLTMVPDVQYTTG